MMKRLLIVSALVLCLCNSAGAEEYSWKAKWITKSECNSQTNSWICFRKGVNVDSVPESLVARIAADTKYWLWINGEMVVLEGGLKRGPSIGDGYYDKVEIAPYLRKGNNMVAVLVWYFGRSGFSHSGTGTCAMLFDAQSPGLEILSDESWEASVEHSFQTASCRMPNYRLPESNIRFDARRYPSDWMLGKNPKYLGRPLEIPVRIGEPPFGKLVERPIPLWKDYGLKEYSSIRQSGDTLYCSLPYNCHFTPWMRLEAPAGKVVTMLTDHDFVGTEKCVSAEYVTKAGVQEFECFGWMNGEVAMYVIPEGVSLKEVKFRESGYDTSFSGTFSCSDDLLNEYWLKAQRTLYVCMRDTYYDCPDRERAQWWGDEVNELNEAFHLLDRRADLLARKGILELVNWQSPEGVLYAPVPTSNYFKELPMQILNSVGWYGFRNYSFYSGDYSVVPLVYDRVSKYLHEVWKLDPDGMPIYRKGGWDWPDAGEHKDRNALLPMWYYLALKAEAEAASYLGREEDAARDRAMMIRISEVFNEKFWNGSCYMSPGYQDVPDDRVQALAVISGVAPSERYPALKKVFAEQMHATTYMFPYVLEALFRMGEPQMALDRMRKFYPTVMKEGCSTLYEHWNFDGSSNHAWAGGGVVPMVRCLAGIEALEPGYKTFTVNPQMGDLTWLETGFDTVYGRIEVSLRRKGRRIEATVLVPEGTTCLIPGKVNGSVTTLGPGHHTLRLR